MGRPAFTVGSMTADALLSRLDRVRRTGPGRWIARCPAHEDRSPSLAIRELDDGRVLVHDFGGCEVEAILTAISMSLEDLFPDRISHHGKPERRHFPASDILRALACDCAYVAVIATRIAADRTVDDETAESLRHVAGRFVAALMYSGVDHG